MKVAFRVDASSQIGTGHLMRCLTLADALKQRGALTRFVSRHMPEHFRTMLVSKGHEFTLLQSSPDGENTDRLVHSHWLGTGQLADAQETIQVLSDMAWDWLVVDHYALDERWETALRKAARNILVIDDLADRTHDCDVLLDQNLHADMDSRYGSNVPKHCQSLLGPRYALLRDEFRQLHEKTIPRNGTVKRVLVFFGGIDADNYTGQSIEALGNIEDQLQVDVVIGTEHPYRMQIDAECVRLGFTFHVQTSRMAELMAVADLSIGAGGTASWERCCLGLPALVVSLADNQVCIAKELGLFGACIHLGYLDNVDAADIHGAVVDLVRHPERLQALSQKAYSLVDGLGVDRLRQVMGVGHENRYSVH